MEPSTQGDNAVAMKKHAAFVWRNIKFKSSKDQTKYPTDIQKCKIVAVQRLLTVAK